MTIMAPADENELQHMLKTAFSVQGPVAIRYPRGSAAGVAMDKDPKDIEIGKAKIMAEGKDVCVVCVGSTVYPAIAAAKLLAQKDISACVVNMRFLKPLDEKTLEALSNRFSQFVVVEENAGIGGLSDAVSSLFAGKALRLLKVALPDKFIEHGSQQLLREKYGLTAEKLAENIGKWHKPS
jgi:1-deoxy-D-xylulose-5-phosphate synthase